MRRVRTDRPGRKIQHLGVIAVLGVAMAVGASSGPAAATTTVSDAAVPRAHCAPGDKPETDAQGRVPAADVASGRAKLGYTCNTAVVGHYADGAQFKTQRFVDGAGHVCAFFDTTQTNFLTGTGLSDGVRVLDMSNPVKPTLTATLSTPAMLSPHESLFLNDKRGLLVADMGSAVAAPGFVDVYDLNQDCRHPVLKSSTPLGILGHESGFAPDGKTFYVASGLGHTLAAVDLTDPARPALLTVYLGAYPHGVRVSADGNRLYVADLGNFLPNGSQVPGLRILDVSQVQARVPNPQITEISTLDWSNKSAPQVPIPVTIKGHKYLVEVDEFSSGITYDPAAQVGAARIIDIDDDLHPKVVSNIRLEVHTLAARSGDQRNDPNGSSDASGYTAHYCNVPREVDPGIVACSFIRSGLRIFDIRDPLHPREVGYFNAPGQDGGAAYSAPAFDTANHQIWYTDQSSGFWAVKVNSAAWPS